MHKLITWTIEEAKIDLLISFPKEFMNDDTKEVVAWVEEYNSRHGVVPAKERFQKKFPHFVLMKYNPKIPITDIAEQELEEARREYILAQIALIEEIILDDGIIPQDVITEMSRMSQMGTGNFAIYSTFNRGAYFPSAVDKVFYTGINLIDAATGGFRSTDFTILSARLGVGKTTIAQFLTYRWWREGARILFISPEMDATGIFGRIDAMVGGFNPLELRSEAIKTSVAKKLSGVELIARHGAGEIIIPKINLITPATIEAAAKSFNVDLIVVDALYLLQPNANTFTSNWQKVMAVSNELKLIARSNGIPVLGITQIKRGARGKVHYDAEDLSFSDSIGQDADFVLTLKEATYEEEDSNILEIELIKSRHGHIAASQIEIDWDNMTLTDISSGSSV